MQRAARLLIGLVLFGFSLALLVKADLGLDPWNVFSQGVSRHAGLSLGAVTVISSLVLLIAFLPLHQRIGVGTVANALIIGPVLDLGLALIPAPHGFGWQLLCLMSAVLGIAIATGLYVGAGWGPGPRDGLMTGIAARGIPLHAARAGIEITVLAIGWALGGTVGLGTVLFAVVIGPLVHRTVPALAIPPQ